MKLFQCAACDNVLFFENTTCGKCGHALAYLPAEATLSALEPVKGADAGKASEVYTALAGPAKGSLVKLCENYAAGACNWAMPAEEKDQVFCRSCRLSTVIPNLGEPAAMLFLRSPGGISHHPDENVLAGDVQAALEAGMEFIRNV